MSIVKRFLNSLNRKKFVNFDSSALSRTLTLLDLTALGIGSTVGVGFYILAGQVARETAGPAVTISFLIAAVASVFAGLCYAEFGARVPKAGSAYVYSYVCVGEFVAFIIGWNLLLEYVIGTASVARGYSAYIDDLANHSISNAFNNAMHMDVKALADYPDFFAFGVTLLLTAVLCIGVKESTRANNVFTGINIFVIAYVIIAGGTQGDVHNWHLTQDEVNNRTFCPEAHDPDADDPYDWGSGGFAPYGVEGIMQGAATCFFGFVGFDVIATTGEEALRPERNIPLSISISLFVIFLAYFGMSTVLTLALPYCLADPDAPLIELFNDKDMMVSKWIVSVGAIFGFSASLLGAMFPMPRILYAMADDGLIFRFFARINKRFKTPMIATIISGILAGIMTLLFSLDSLVDMMSIGTLMAYTIVSVCVMLLRYTPDEETDFVTMSKNAAANIETKFDVLHYSWKDYARQLVNLNHLKEPSQLSSTLVNYATLAYSFICFLLALFVALFSKEIGRGEVGKIVLVSIFGVLTIGIACIIALQPPSKKKLSFQVPFVPWVPALSTFINLYLMCNLSGATWIRFVVWMAIGFAIYFLYGIRNSSGSVVPLTKPTEKENEGMEINIINKHIPPIVVLPPTPGGSRLGTPTNTLVRTTPDEKVSSIIKSAPVMASSTQAKDINAKKVDTVVVDVDETSQIESNSQYIDSSPLELEKNDCPVTDFESEINGDEILGKINKLTSASILISAAVDGDDSNIAHKTKSEDEDGLLQSKTQKENYPFAGQSDNSDRLTIDSGVEVSNFKDSTTPVSSNSSETSITEDKKTFEIQITTPAIVDNYEASPIISTSDSHAETENSRSKSVPFFEWEDRVISSVKMGDASLISSEPGTPKRKRPHPIKVLARASSFDDIPPSTPDSPFAKKVKNFIIIPVNIPNKDGDMGSDSSLSSDEQRAPTSSVISTPQINLPSDHNDKANQNMISDLNIKLKYLEKSNALKAQGADSINNDSSIFMFPPLDPIRERGESKVSQTDIKTIADNFESSKSNGS